MSQSSPKNPILDIAKGLGVLLVVYGHLIQFSMAPWGQDFFANPVFKIIYTFHMPLFVVVSGYLMAYSLQRHLWQEALQSRCKSLLVPFLVLAVIGAGLITVFDHKAGIGQELAKQLFVDPQVWFLWTLYMMSAALILSAELAKQIGLSAFVLVYVLLMLIPSDLAALYYIKWFYLFFLAGYFLNRQRIQVSNTMARRCILVVSLALFCLFLPYWTTHDYIYNNKMQISFSHYPVELLRVAYRYGLGFAGIIVAYYLAEALSQTKLAAVMGKIGQYSLDIYIIQMFLVEGLYPRVLAKMHWILDCHAPTVLIICLPLMTLVFTGLCMLISRFFIRNCSYLNILLLGGRG